MDRLIDGLLSQGIMGIIVVAMGWYILRIQDRHEKERSQFNDRWEATATRLNDSAEKNAGLMETIKELLQAALKR